MRTKSQQGDTGYKTIMKMTNKHTSSHGFTPFTREGSPPQVQGDKPSAEVARHLGTPFSGVRAVGTAVARSLHTREVTGSIPVPPTKRDRHTYTFPHQLMPLEAAQCEADLEEALQSIVDHRAKMAETRETPMPRQVYVIHAEGTDLHKIGVAVCAKKRLQTLQKGFPYRLDLVAVVDVPPGEIFQYERHLHRLMADCRVEGEWFEFSPESFRASIDAVIAKRTA